MEKGKPLTQQHCFIVEPIAEKGYALLRSAGIEPVHASASDMATVVREVGNCVAVVTRDAGFSRDAISAAPALKVIGNHGTGVDPVDVSFATERGVAVVNTPGANLQSVAEHTVALLLSVVRRLSTADEAVRRANETFKFRTQFFELHGKTAGIIGFGNTGRAVAALLKHAFSMNISVYSPSADPQQIEELGYRKFGDLSEMVKGADVVTIHVPLKPETRGLISRELMGNFRRSAVLINTSRGAIVDEEALAEGLNQGEIFGAGLDVFTSEVPPTDHPLLTCRNAVLSPHIAGSTVEALERTAEMVCSQVVQLLNGKKPAHLVNPQVWADR